VRFNG